MILSMYLKQKPRSFARREAIASPTEFPQHCVLLVPPFAMGFTGAEGLVDAMKKQNDHQWGRKGKVPFLKGKVKKTHPLEVRLKLILGPCRNLQILSQNLFNHCMGDATASLRANDRGFSLNIVLMEILTPILVVLTWIFQFLKWNPYFVVNCLLQYFIRMALKDADHWLLKNSLLLYLNNNLI